MAWRSVSSALCALVFLLTCLEWGNGLLDSLPEAALHTLLYKVNAWSQLAVPGRQVSSSAFFHQCSSRIS